MSIKPQSFGIGLRSWLWGNTAEAQYGKYIITEVTATSKGIYPELDDVLSAFSEFLQMVRHFISSIKWFVTSSSVDDCSDVISPSNSYCSSVLVVFWLLRGEEKIKTRTVESNLLSLIFSDLMHKIQPPHLHANVHAQNYHLQ